MAQEKEEKVSVAQEKPQGRASEAPGKEEEVWVTLETMSGRVSVSQGKGQAQASGVLLN